MTDHLIAVCKLCGHTVRISLEHGGRRAKCPRCDGIIEIPKGETSVRLRSDVELTKEARAKAGRMGPDSDNDIGAARPGAHPTTARMRRVVKKPGPARRMALVVTLIATAAVLGGIVLIIFKQPPAKTVPAAPPPPPPKKPPPPPPPAPPPDPHAVEKEEMKDLIRKFVEVFNKNDLPKLVGFYTCDLDTLRKAFGVLSIDDLLTYEDVKIKSIEFPERDIKVTIVFNRVLKNTATGVAEKQEGVERVLVWSVVDGKYKLSSKPEP